MFKIRGTYKDQIKTTCKDKWSEKLGLTGLNKNFQKNRQSDVTNVVSEQPDDASYTILYHLINIIFKFIF